MKIASRVTVESEKENLALLPSNKTDNNVSCKIILSSRWFIHDNHDFLSTVKFNKTVQSVFLFNMSVRVCVIRFCRVSQESIRLLKIDFFSD